MLQNILMKYVLIFINHFKCKYKTIIYIHFQRKNILLHFFYILNYRMLRLLISNKSRHLSTIKKLDIFSEF